MLIYLQMIESEADKSKFERLYLRYRGLMFSVAMRLLSNEQDAEDAVHQAFLSIISDETLVFYLHGFFDKAVMLRIAESVKPSRATN